MVVCCLSDVFTKTVCSELMSLWALESSSVLLNQYFKNHLVIIIWSNHLNNT